MPEGPQVFRYAEKLRNLIQGAILDTVQIGKEQRFPRSRVSKILTKGKRIVVCMENGDGVLLAFALGGGLDYYSNPSELEYDVSNPLESPKDQIALLKLLTNDGEEVFVTLTDPQRFAIAKLDTITGITKTLLPKGFDPLHTIMGMREWQDLCKSQNGQLVANFITNQNYIAGIGNRYRSEILHAARISPGSRVGELSSDDLERLLISIYRVMKLASRGEYIYTIHGKTETVPEGEPVARVEVAKGVLVWTTFKDVVSARRKPKTPSEEREKPKTSVRGRGKAKVKELEETREQDQVFKILDEGKEKRPRTRIKKSQKSENIDDNVD